MDLEKSFLFYLVLIFYIFSLKKTKKFPFLLSLQLSPKTLFDCLFIYLFIYLLLTMLLFVVFVARPHTSTRTIVLTTTVLGMTKARLTALKSYR